MTSERGGEAQRPQGPGGSAALPDLDVDRARLLPCGLDHVGDAEVHVHVVFQPGRGQHEGSRPVPPVEDPLGFQQGDRLAHGGAADSQPGRELRFGRQLSVQGQAAVRDAVTQALGDQFGEVLPPADSDPAHHVESFRRRSEPEIMRVTPAFRDR
jgi:hypothetical protein